MIYKKIAELIQEKYNFINEPPESEIIDILKQLNQNTTEEEFEKIIYSIVSDRMSMLNESIDMSGSISILKQIRELAKK